MNLRINLRVRERVLRLDCGAEVKEVFSDFDVPERPRDWDFEGDSKALYAEIAKDCWEFGCNSYTVIHDEIGYRVWRLIG